MCDELLRIDLKVNLLLLIGFEVVLEDDILDVLDLVDLVIVEILVLERVC